MQDKIISLILKLILSLDWLPYAKRAIGSVVALALVWLQRIPLPEGVSPPPMGAFKEVLTWIATVLIVLGWTVWGARKVALARGLEVPQVIDVKRLG